MSEGWKYVFAVIGSGAFATLVGWILNRLDKRQSKKNGTEKRLEAIEASLAGISSDMQEVKADAATRREHDELQYLSILRLTVMDSDMPMSERLIAGAEYLRHGGNGDVKKYYEALERKVNA